MFVGGAAVVGSGRAVSAAWSPSSACLADLVAAAFVFVVGGDVADRFV